MVDHVVNPSTKFEDISYSYPFLTYDVSPQATINNAFGATAHASYHANTA